MITCTFESGKTASLRHVVVHAIVEKEGKLLLIKRSESLSLEGGKWALPGGFLDRDETAAEASIRELREESGWEGEVVSLFRINTNSNRPHEDRQNVALDFLIKPIRKSGSMDYETSNIAWIPLDQMPPSETLAFDHGESIQLYRTYRKTPFPLPLVV